MPTNGSVGTLTFSPRYISQVRDLLERERFDLLHFHEPFVPFLSLFLLRESHSVNVATFHAYAGFSPSYELGSRVMRGHAARLHGRIAVSAAARHFIDRFFPGDYKVIPNGVDVAALRRTPSRSRAGRTARRTSCSSAGTSRARACSTCSRRTGSCARPATATRLLVVGSGPQEREARRYVATRGLQGVEFLGRVTDAEKAQLFRTADVFASPATGGESFGIVLLEAMAAGRADRRLGHPRLQGRRPARPRGPARPAARARRSWPMAIARLLDDPALRAEMGAAGRAAGRGVQLAAGDRQGRGLLRLRHPPARRERAACRPASGPPIPQAPPVRAPGRRRRSRRPCRSAVALDQRAAARPRPSRRPPGRSRRAPARSSRAVGVRSGVSTRCGRPC